MNATHAHRRTAAHVAAALLVAILGVAGAQAQIPGTSPFFPAPQKAAVAPAAAAAPSSREEIRKEFDAAQAALAQIERSPGAALAAPPGTPATEIAERASLARQLAGVYQQQLDLLDRTQALERERGEAETERREWRGFGVPHPLPVLAVDTVRDDLESADARIASSTRRRELFERFGDDVSAKLGASQAAARLAAEAADSGKSGPAASALAWKRELTALRAQVDLATRELIDLALRNAREEVATSTASRELALRKLAAAGTEFTLSPADHERIRAEVEARRRANQREIDRALRAAATAVDARDGTEARLAEARRSPKPGDEAREAELARDAEAKRELAATAQLRVNLLKEYQVMLGGEQQAWEARSAALASRSTLEARTIFEKLRGSLAMLATWREYLAQQQDAVRANVQEQETKLRNASGDDAALAAQLLDTFRQREADVARAVDAGQPLERLLRRFRADLESQRSASFAERTKDAGAAALLALRRAWSFELFTVDDTFETPDGRRLAVARSVTLGKTVGAVLIVVLGYLVVRFLARRVERLAVARGHVAPQTAAALRDWILFALTAVLVIFALVSASIPLTAFAFLGGALAIAAGFGLQTLLKNLVAGIILLASRPMRLGDLVEVDGTRGRVTEVGLRSSTILTADGIESLIPNSAFLEGKLTNWTYTSQQTRQSINVGVAYGTPLRKAADALLGVLGRHGLVLKSPAPQVYLDGYGDSSVNFALTYWVDMAPDNDVRRVRSDLLHMIDTAFAEAGIRMPFPQRDVHVDAAAPLKVELVPGAKPGA